MNFRIPSFTSILFIFFGPIFFLTSNTVRAETLHEFLVAFHADPTTVMQRLPYRVDGRGQAHSRGNIPIDIVKRMFPARLEMRQEIIAKAPLSFSDVLSLPNADDRAAQLVDGGSLVAGIDDLDNRHLTSATIAPPPWDDSYWPVYKGLIATRYADPHFPNSSRWETNYDYFMNNPPSSIVASHSATNIDGLSPAEKYDYVMGDSSYGLTQFAWGIGRKTANDDGYTPKWTGICNGWSAASHMQAPYVHRPVVVLAQDGTPVTFYPSDAKALISMLWAYASPNTRFIGQKCTVFNPPRDSSGHVLDPACADNNPATWHLAISNQLGIHHRSFVMDGTYDAEVWNYPLISYQSTYFNPQSLQPTHVLSAALIPIEKFTIDKFRAYRTSGVKYVVGISMDVTFAAETNPTRAPPSTTPYTKTLRFIYDLELDANRNIIGGEWYSIAHPDFLWTYDVGAHALAAGDPAVINDPWTLDQPVPANWTAAAQRSSARGAPLASFIKRLTDAAPAAETPPLAAAVLRRF